LRILMNQTTLPNLKYPVNVWRCPRCGIENQPADSACKNCGAAKDNPPAWVKSIQEAPPALSARKDIVKEKPHLGRILVWALLFFLLGVITIVLLLKQQGPISIGQKPPSFMITTFDGQQISSTDLSGKVMLVNFWASWCVTCEQEAVDLESAWQYYRPRGDVLFIGIAWTDTENASLAYIQEHDITYPNGPDLGTKISQAYRITGVPETYIINKQGILASLKLSPYASVDEIKAAIDPLLGP
jgi:cytochrome c biogenesis protein CcmG/thiol:disulfide interchange protein DsbE